MNKSKKNIFELEEVDLTALGRRLLEKEENLLRSGDCIQRKEQEISNDAFESEKSTMARDLFEAAIPNHTSMRFGLYPENTHVYSSDELLKVPDGTGVTLHDVRMDTDTIGYVFDGQWFSLTSGCEIVPLQSIAKMMNIGRVTAFHMWGMEVPQECMKYRMDLKSATYVREFCIRINVDSIMRFLGEAENWSIHNTTLFGEKFQAEGTILVKKELDSVENYLDTYCPEVYLVEAEVCRRTTKAPVMKKFPAVKFFMRGTAYFSDEKELHTFMTKHNVMVGREIWMDVSKGWRVEDKCLTRYKRCSEEGLELWYWEPLENIPSEGLKNNKEQIVTDESDVRRIAEPTKEIRSSIPRNVVEKFSLDDKNTQLYSVEDFVGLSNGVVVVLYDATTDSTTMGFVFDGQWFSLMKNYSMMSLQKIVGMMNAGKIVAFNMYRMELLQEEISYTMDVDPHTVDRLYHIMIQAEGIIPLIRNIDYFRIGRTTLLEDKIVINVPMCCATGIEYAEQFLTELIPDIRWKEIDIFRRTPKSFEEEECPDVKFSLRGTVSLLDETELSTLITEYRIKVLENIWMDLSSGWKVSAREISFFKERNYENLKLYYWEPFEMDQ